MNELLDPTSRKSQGLGVSNNGQFPNSYTNQKYSKSSQPSANEILLDLQPISQIYEELEQDIQERGTSPKYPSGIDILDKLIWGFHKRQLLVLGSRTSMGKCLGKGTSVLMYDGTYRLVECIKTGDKVMGIDSQPREVINTCNGIDDMYKIKQLRGNDYIVNSQHILSLKLTGDKSYSHPRNKKTVIREHSKGKTVNISVKDYLKKSKKFKHNYKGYITGVEFKRKKVSLEPYFLGLWLGDGTSTKPTITSTDKEIEKYLNNFAAKNNMFVTKEQNTGSSAFNYHIVSQKGSGGAKKNLLLDKLRNLNLINNKHIPECYKINNKELRLQLLAGLLDTDGYLANTSGLIFCNTNKTLAEDVYWLARSVGYYAKVKEYTAKIKNINYQTTAYKVYISAKSFIDLPMLLAYKKPNKKMKRTDPQKTGISIECIGKGEYYGFALQGKDCLFILEDFTVTHNSIFAVNSAIQLAKLDLKVVYFSLEMSKLQVVERIVTHICTINNMALKEGELKKEFKEGKNLFTEWADSNRLLIDDKYGYDFDTLIKVCQVTEPDFVIIDHIQMIKATGKGGKLEAIEEYIRRLKQLSLECNFGIILLSQINRGGISNPGMEFLKWGGILEELADTCIIITTDWQNFITHFNIAKQRHRGTGTLDLKIEPQYSKFREFTNEEREQNAGTYFRDN